MPYATSKLVTMVVICDMCKKRDKYQGVNITDTKRQAEEDEWVFVEGDVRRYGPCLCFDCAIRQRSRGPRNTLFSSHESMS